MKKALFLLIFGPCFLFSNPENGNVILGEASIAVDGKTLNILCGDKTIINWESFSIGNDETTRFHMPNESSAVLNKVIGNTPSSLLGTLLADGRVFLLNPHGIIIGKDAYINVASFLASTLDLIDGDFSKNGELFFKGGSKEALINLGKIESMNGDIALIGRIVKNAGELSAKKGSTLLAAGKEVLLKLDSSDKIFIRPELDTTDKMDIGIENSGQIEALRSELKADGNVYALAIKDSGTIDALGFQESGGEVFLIADGGTVEHSGKIIAQNGVTGGKVHIFSKNVGLLDEGQIDVSAPQGDGEVLIGGNRIDDKPIFYSDVVYCSEKAKVMADATNNGDGGRILFLGNKGAIFTGSFSAKGGPNGGNGGFIETSSNGFLNVTGNANTIAPKGLIGNFLLDPPADVHVGPATPPQAHVSGTGPFLYYTDTLFNSFNISSASLQGNLNSSSVTIQTHPTSESTPSTLPAFGSVFFDVGFPITWNAATTLTVKADLGIFVNSSITFNSGAFAPNQNAIDFLAKTKIDINNGSSISGAAGNGSVNMNITPYTASTGNLLIVESSSSIVTNAGNVNLQLTNVSPNTTGTIAIFNDSNITTQGGVVNLTVPVADATFGGIDINEGYINTNSGTITLNVNTKSTNFLDVSIGEDALSGSLNLPSYISSATGDVNINCLGKVLIKGGDGGVDSSAYINTGGNITINAGSGSADDIVLQGGQGSNSPAYITSTGTYIFIDTAGASGSLTLNGGTGDVSYAKIRVPNGYIYDDLLGNLTIQAGTGTIDSSAGIFVEGIARLAANNVVLTAGPNATTSNEAAIVSTIGEVLLVTTGNFILTGGASVTKCDAHISSPSDDVNVINNAAGSLTLITPSGGRSYINAQQSVQFSHLSDITLNAINADAYISGNAGIDINSTYSAPSGKLTLQSGIGSAHITSGGNIVINTAGGVSDYIKLLGGTGVNSPASISSTGFININASVPGAGYLTFTGGSGATSYAKMSTASGNITCKLLGDSTITAGTGATDSSAGIFAGGSVTLSSKNLNLFGGSVGAANLAAISSASSNVTINASGNIVLTGGNLAGCDAYINAPSGTISISGGDLILNTPNSGLAYIESQGQLTLNNLSTLALNAVNASAYIDTTGGSLIDISTDALSINGGSSASADCNAYIFTTGNVICDVGDGPSNITGGSSANLCRAQIAGLFGTVSISNSGLFTIEGGSSTNSGSATIDSFGTFTFFNSGILTLRGGSAAGGQNFAKMTSNNDSMILDGGGVFNFYGGSADGCFASAFANGSLQLGNMYALLLQGSDNGVTSAYADISSSFGIAPYNNGTIGNITLIGGNGTSCSASIESINTVTLNASHNISLVGGASSTSDARIESDLYGISLDAGNNVSLHGDFANITAFEDVKVNAGSNIVLNGSNVLNPVLITSQIGNVSLTAGNNVELLNSSTILVNSGDLTIIAGHDISIGSGSSIVNTSSGNLTLVVDNDNSDPPNIGHGSFTIESGGTITAGGPLRIFTALRELNDIEGPINVVFFNPGPIGVNSQFEQWNVYFPNNFWGGLGFTLFYKSGTPLPHLLFPVNAVALSELMYLLNSLQIDFIILDPCYRYIKQCKEFTIKYRCPVECRNLNMRVAPL